MSAEVLKLDPRNPDQQGVRYAASWLRRGAVVAIPTDTLYALAADPVNLAAVEEIFKVKGRPESRALPILINSLAQARMLSRDLPANFYRLANACWPGPLTMVVEASNRLPLKVTGNTRRIALRWPRNKIVSHLIEEFGVPLDGHERESDRVDDVFEFAGSDGAVGGPDSVDCGCGRGGGVYAVDDCGIARGALVHWKRGCDSGGID